MSPPACNDCIYYREMKRGEGTCRFHPPRPRNLVRGVDACDTDHYVAFWPVVLEDEFCSEFRPGVIRRLPD